jgi:hypothetical protein
MGRSEEIMGTVRGQKKERVAGRPGRKAPDVVTAAGAGRGDEGSVPSAGERLRSRETAVKVFVAGVTFVALFPVNKTAAIAGAMLAPVVSELVTDYVQRHRWSVRRLRRGSVAVAGIGYGEDDAYAARRRAGPRSGGRAPGALLAGGAAATVAIGAIALAMTARDHGRAAPALQTGDGPPSQVSGLAGDRRTTHEPRITWHAVPGAGRYIIFRGGRRIATRTGLRFTDTVTAYATYVYRVAAEANGRTGSPSDGYAITFFQAGHSPGSPSTSHPTEPPPPPIEVAAPTGLQSIGPVTGPPSLRWTPVPDARYAVYRDRTFITNVEEPAFDDSSADVARGIHTYWVRAWVGGRESRRSEGVAVDYQPLVGPVLSGDTPTTHPPRFSWTDVKGASGFVVYVGTAEVWRGSSQSWADPAAVPGNTYVYTVRALDSHGNLGDPSDPLTIEFDAAVSP